MKKYASSWLGIAVVLVLVGVLAACAPAETPAPAEEATEEPTEPALVEDEWSRVQSAGKMLVGTSADYPPFEFINEDNEFDGFDIALMNEIGERLGVEVEWQDIAFDGLIAAVKAGQIDAIIAAMAATPERDEQVDFTLNYYVGSDAVLLAEGSDIVIEAPEDSAGHKIGVQSGTIHEGWVQDNLIETGMMDEADLSRYERADQAILDLKSGRIDVVIMDYYAAAAFVQQGGVELVLEQNLLGESQAIAIPEGADELKAVLDEVIQGLIDEGFVEGLIQEYLVSEDEAAIEDPVWSAIQDKGVLVVGTSADYPPFEFIDEDNEYAGFDIALMNEVADRLGLEIEWQDISFDGLIAALKAGQIDAIIAAMAATPERDEQVDFTINYYEGSDAVLVAEGSGVVVEKPEDSAAFKIGVQSGTIHEGWVQDNLIEPGLMDESGLSRYERADQAVLDLKSGRIEVVIIDYYAAKAFVEQGGLTLAIEQNLLGESQAIAVPEGAAGVKAAMDGVIQELLDEGYVDQLIEEYLVAVE
jgi:polar amino acid transport system substrate-binding protein